MSRDKRPPGIATAFRNFDYETEIDRLKRSGGTGGGAPPAPGIDDKNYVHTQSTLASTWVVTHPLNKRPSVTVVDSGDSVLLADVHYDSNSQITIGFSAATSGKVYLN